MRLVSKLYLSNTSVYPICVYVCHGKHKGCRSAVDENGPKVDKNHVYQVEWYFWGGFGGSWWGTKDFWNLPLLMCCRPQCLPSLLRLLKIFVMFAIFAFELFILGNYLKYLPCLPYLPWLYFRIGGRSGVQEPGPACLLIKPHHGRNPRRKSRENDRYKKHVAQCVRINFAGIRTMKKLVKSRVYCWYWEVAWFWPKISVKKM